MRQLMLGLCLFAASCSDTGRPTAPSALDETAAAQLQATTGASNASIEVSFAKWIDGAFPQFIGVASGDVTGDGTPDAGVFAATVLKREPSDNGNLVYLQADYTVFDNDPAHRFVARIEGNQNNQIQSAVLNGTVIDGWLLGARVHVTFDVVQPCPQHGQTRCFVGVLRVMPGSAN